ncbi:MAG: ABC transporter permease [Chloroflexi bacterium]|uniref:ABC transporter permease n=1 Tax=Candidatus Flexifilum breve TaxID=3140694 RepID=UPI003136BBD2|nr:ABC transporter permease [Chloroflexota bacterium]
MNQLPPVIDIVPPAKWRLPDLRELYEFRELLYTLTWRDIRVMYKQTIIGAPWAILQPLLLMIIYTLVFGLILRVPTNEIPYTLFIFAGLLGWNFFATGIMRASTSVLANANLVRKVYFPHLLLPVAAVFGGIIDLIPALLLSLLLALVYGFLPTWNLFSIVPTLILLLITTLGVGFWVAALLTKYRDVSIALPLILQILFYVSPVLYTSSLFGETWRILMGIFPVSVIVESFRWSLTSTGEPPLLITSIIAWCSAFLILVGGMLFFQRMDPEFVDLV